jgi:hypothetical protein
MPTGNEYREYANECIEWAKTAKSLTERNTFLDMAEAWLRAATVAEMPTRVESKPINADRDSTLVDSDATD